MIEPPPACDEVRRRQPYGVPGSGQVDVEIVSRQTSWRDLVPRSGVCRCPRCRPRCRGGPAGRRRRRSRPSAHRVADVGLAWRRCAGRAPRPGGPSRRGPPRWPPEYCRRPAPASQMSTAMMSAPSCGEPDRVTAALSARGPGDECDFAFYTPHRVPPLGSVRRTRLSSRPRQRGRTAIGPREFGACSGGAIGAGSAVRSAGSKPGERIFRARADGRRGEVLPAATA